MPITAGNEVATTELQQSIFNAPPSSMVAPTPAAVSVAVTKVPASGANIIDVDTGGPQGVKRRREDESDEEGVPMEEGDSDAPMDASSDEDSS